MGVPRKSIEPWFKDSVEFYSHQVDGVRQMTKMRSVILADEMGLGKTMQSLAVFAWDVRRGYASKLIVVCPASLKRNWSREIRHYTRIPHVVLDGTPVKRQQQLEQFELLEGPKALVVNYEQVGQYVDRLNMNRFDMVIFDEAHYLKNPRTARTSACRQLDTRRSFLLTGTPVLNHVDELWTLLDRVSPGAWKTYHRFKSRFCVMGGYKDKQIVGVKNEHELNEGLNKVMVRRFAKDVLDLPPLTFQTKMVGLTARQQQLYDQAYGEMQMDLTDGSTQEIANGAVKFMRLRQICDTTATVEDTDLSQKLSLVVDDIVELAKSGRHAIVFTQWRAVIAALRHRVETQQFDVPVYEVHGDVAADARQDVVDEWSADKPGVILCMYQVAGVGLNMTKATAVLRVDKMPVPGQNDQAVKRAMRIGQEHRVQVIDYIVEKTVEHRIDDILEKKAKVHDLVLDADNNPIGNLMLAVMRADREEQAYSE